MTEIDNKKAQHKLRKRNKKKSKKQRQQEEAKRKAVSRSRKRSVVIVLTVLKELEKQQENDDSLDDVQIEYVVQPVDVGALKNMDGMSSLDDSTLQQFSDIFKHFQVGKPDEDDAVSFVCNCCNFSKLTSLC